MDAFNMDFDLAFGEVVNVQQIRSRGVTRIEIEIPTESHVKATSLLFGKGALVIPWWNPEANVGPYGVRKLSHFFNAGSDAPGEFQRDIGAVRRTSGFGATPYKKTCDYVQLAGITCRDDKDFWVVLGDITGTNVECENDAVEALKSVLGIASRTELSHNQMSQIAFDDLLKMRKTNMSGEAQ